MASRALESLSVTASPPRSVEPPPRAAGGRKFGSALDEALHAEPRDETVDRADSPPTQGPSAPQEGEPLCTLPCDDAATGDADAMHGAVFVEESTDDVEAALAAAAALPTATPREAIAEVAPAADEEAPTAAIAETQPPSADAAPAPAPAGPADAAAADPAASLPADDQPAGVDEAPTPSPPSADGGDGATATPNAQRTTAPGDADRETGAAPIDDDAPADESSTAERSTPRAARPAAASNDAAPAAPLEGADLAPPPVDAAPAEADRSPPTETRPAATPTPEAAPAGLAPRRSLQTPATPRDAGEAAQVDRGRFLGRVEGAIRAAQQRDGRVQVRLSPPELGSLRIELTIENGLLSARLEAETPAARKVLLDNLPALRERLAQQDVRVERFDVDVRRDGGGSGGSGPQDRPTGDPAPRQGDERRERAAPRAAATPARAAAPAKSANGNAALDVRV